MNIVSPLFTFDMNGSVFSCDPSEGVIFLSLNPAYKPVTRLFAELACKL